jgi:small basic protein
MAIARNCRAAILDALIGNQFANTVPSHGFFGRLVISLKLLFRLGERAGARTQDPVIKSYGFRDFTGFHPLSLNCIKRWYY